MLVLFPNQLFAGLTEQHIVLIEDTLFFKDPERDLSFNGIKLIYQRTCMKKFEAAMKKAGKTVTYIEWQKPVMFWKKLVTDPIFIDPKDHLLRRRILQAFPATKFLPSPSFLNPEIESAHFYNFYERCRKKYRILVRGDNPLGGKWSFDDQNRETIKGSFKTFCQSKGIKYALPTKSVNEEAIEYVENAAFHDGVWDYDADNLRFFATTHADAVSFLQYFLRDRLQYFMYQDAIVEQPFVFHSLISAALNIGLLTPAQVIREVAKVPLNKQSLPQIEAFIRQLFWREYAARIYEEVGERKFNFMGHTRILSDAWYEGTTGFKILDEAILQANKFGFINHIQRLMVVCNMMNLCMIHPDEVYRWFMEFSVDSYDWVMMFNVYMMGLYAAGPESRVSKPYVCSGNYWRKMSNLPVSDEEYEKLKALYWSFIARYGKKVGGSRIPIPKGINIDAKKYMI